MSEPVICTLYRKPDGSLLVRTDHDAGGLVVETKIGGTVHSVRVDPFHVRELLAALDEWRPLLPAGPVER